MATKARCRRRSLPTVRVGMTGAAHESLVRTCQRKLRLAIVIEAPERPSVRCVAFFAGRSQRTLVMRILVARRAVHRRTAILRRSMTLFARDLRVQTNEWKAAQLVIKAHPLLP